MILVSYKNLELLVTHRPQPVHFEIKFNKRFRQLVYETPNEYHINQGEFVEYDEYDQEI